MIMELLQSAVSQIKYDLANIELVRAAVYASVIGAVLVALRQVPQRLLYWYRRVAITTIEVSNNDAAYVWVQKWLSTQALSKQARHLVVSTSGFQEYDHDDYDDYRRELRKDATISYKPDVGTYLIRYRGYPVFISFVRERIEERNMFAESITFTCFFRRKLALELIREAATYAKQSEKTSISLFLASGTYWQHAGERPFRTLDSLVYAQSLGKTLLDDAQKFVSERNWYTSMGIPWRRGYLLYGPAGNGKTSLAFALASELKFNIYILNLTGGGLTNDSLLNLFNQVPDESIVLIEEVDEAFDKTKKANRSQGLSHTGLLNALDGVSSREGRICIMTTNYRERISPALIRPGRADLHLYVGNATPAQAERMFARFYPEESNELARAFAEKVDALDRELCMAELQNHLLRYRGSPDETIKRVYEVIPEAQKSGVQDKSWPG